MWFSGRSLTIIEAIKKNDLQAFYRLLSLPATSSTKSVLDAIDLKHGGNALHVAVFFNRIDFIAPLIEAGIDVNQPDNECLMTIG